MMANIVCKTVGVAGLSAAVYDAYGVGKHHAHAGSQEASADYFQKIHDASRSATSESHVTNAMQKKVADLRMSNPVIPFLGKVKGFVKGTFESMGDNIFLVSSASLALATKGFFSKLGAWGVAGFGVYKILHEGFGLGKKTPMDE